MNKKIQIAKNHPLFFNIAESELNSMIICLGTYEKIYGKGEFILQQGELVSFVGMVLEGAVKIVKSDWEGNEVIIAEIQKGDIFAEVFACAGVTVSPVSIISSTRSEICFFDFSKVIATCGTSCEFHRKLILNMLNILAQKSIYLNQKIDIISKRTLREKIWAYLEYIARGRMKFRIPLNREELANFLCADRSAVSNELSKMQREGLIRYKKFDFEILN